MRMQGIESRLTLQRLVLDPIDRLVESRGMQPRPRPTGDLQFRLVERLPANAEPFGGTPLDPAARLVVVRNPSGFVTFFDLVESRSGPRRSGLGAGRYTLLVQGALYQPLRIAVDLADTPPPPDALPDDAGARTAVLIRLEPSFVHPLLRGPDQPATALVGAFTDADRSLFDGVRITRLLLNAEAPPHYDLDRRGQWRLDFDAQQIPWNGNDTAEVGLRVRRGATLLGDLTAVPIEKDQVTTREPIPLPGS